MRIRSQGPKSGKSSDGCVGEGHIKRDCTMKKPTLIEPWNKRETTVTQSMDVQKPSVRRKQGSVRGLGHPHGL